MATDEHRALIRFAHEVGHLKRTPRTGWTLAGVRGPESVAEHSHRVAVLAYCIAHTEGADANLAAVLGLFHDVPEARTGDVPSVGKHYVTTSDHAYIATEQAAGLEWSLATHIRGLIYLHEQAKEPGGSVESRCSRDADKLECLLQAREYQREGYRDLDHWVTTMFNAMTTATGKELAAAALEVTPRQWWDSFAENYGKAPR